MNGNLILLGAKRRFCGLSVKLIGRQAPQVRLLSRVPRHAHPTSPAMTRHNDQGCQERRAESSSRQYLHLIRSIDKMKKVVHGFIGCTRLHSLVCLSHFPTLIVKKNSRKGGSSGLPNRRFAEELLLTRKETRETRIVDRGYPICQSHPWDED
jgi:hypothetical protein